MRDRRASFPVRDVREVHVEDETGDVVDDDLHGVVRQRKDHEVRGGEEGEAVDPHTPELGADLRPRLRCPTAAHVRLEAEVGDGGGGLVD